MNDTDDGDLIRRVGSGDRGAFAQLYGRYHRVLARFLTRFSRDYSLAEEIINDTMYVVWNRAAEFRGDSKVSTWIIGIAYRRALKTLERLDVRRKAEFLNAEGEDTSPSGDAAEERADWLEHGMAKLPLEQRIVLEMAYFLGHSCEEIADIVGCPVNTVKTRMFHARRRLRDVLPQLAEPAPDTHRSNS